MTNANTIPNRLADIARHADDTGFLLQLLTPGVPVVRISYLDLMREAVHWVRCFDALGLLPGDRVAIILNHSFDLYASFFAALATGRVPAYLAPPSPRFGAAEFRQMFQALWPQLDAQALVIDESLRATIPANANRYVVSPGDLSRDAAELWLTFYGNGTPDSVAMIQYSSGTTGLKKGVGISHRALLWQLSAYSKAIGLTASDRIASWLPLYHDMGLITSWLMPLLAERPVLAMSPHDWIGRPAWFLEAVAADRSTLAWLPNFAFSILERAATTLDPTTTDLSSVRLLVNCSEPLRHKTVESFRRRLRPFGVAPDAIGASYAMAETTFAVTSTVPGVAAATMAVDRRSICRFAPIETGNDILESSGAPLPDVAVDIVDDQSNVLPEGYVGEIRVAAPCQVDGYLDNPEATANALRNGRLHTGDLGVFKDGELYVIGRMDDVIVVAGQNVQPQDVEACVDGIDGVIPGRSVAFGVADEILGTDRLVVIAETMQATPADCDSIARRVKALVLTELGLAVSDVRIVAARWLAKSTSGKISRRINRERYLDLSIRPPRTAPSIGDDIRSKVRAAVVDALGTEPANDADSLIFDGQMDSLDLAVLHVALEKRVGSTLPMPQEVGFQHFDSVAALIRLAETARSGDLVRRMSSLTSARQVKTEFYARSHRNHDVLILGSSRTMGMPTVPAAARDMSAFNFAVENGRAEDIYAIQAFVHARAQRLPGYLIIGIEPETFGKAGGLDVRLMECRELYDYLRAPGSPPLDSMVEQKIVENSAKLRLEHLRFAEWPTGDFGYHEGTGDLQYWSADGPRPSPTERSPLDFESTKRSAYLSLKDFQILNEGRRKLFTMVAARAREAGTKLLCYLSPLPPELDRFLRSETAYADILGQILEFVGSVCGPDGLIRDFSTPDRFGGDDENFDDTTHAGVENQALILARLLDEAGGKAPWKSPLMTSV